MTLKLWSVKGFISFGTVKGMEMKGYDYFLCIRYKMFPTNSSEHWYNRKVTFILIQVKLIWMKLLSIIFHIISGVYAGWGYVGFILAAAPYAICPTK